MRKFLVFVCTAIALLASSVALTSCDPADNGAKFGILYDLNIDGDADGAVSVTFPNGSLDLDGKTGLDFTYSNDTTKAFLSPVVMTEEEILSSGDPGKINALTAINMWADSTIQASATKAGGTYDLHVKGYVKETLTGITVEIDKRLTNREG